MSKTKLTRIRICCRIFNYVEKQLHACQTIADFNILWSWHRGNKRKQVMKQIILVRQRSPVSSLNFSMCYCLSKFWHQRQTDSPRQKTKPCSQLTPPCLLSLVFIYTEIEDLSDGRGRRRSRTIQETMLLIAAGRDQQIAKLKKAAQLQVSFIKGQEQICSMCFSCLRPYVYLQDLNLMQKTKLACFLSFFVGLRDWSCQLDLVYTLLYFYFSWLCVEKCWHQIILAASITHSQQ